MAENPSCQYAFLRFLQSKDISTYDFQKPINTEFQTSLEKHSAPVLATFLAKKVQSQVIDHQTYGSTVLYEEFKGYLKINNFKYEMDTKKFAFEMKNTYLVNHYKTNGKMSFKIDKPSLQKLLETKYKISFDEIGEEDKEYDEEDDNNEYISTIKQLREEIKRLKEQLSNKDTLNEDSECTFNNITHNDYVFNNITKSIFYMNDDEDVEDVKPKKAVKKVKKVNVGDFCDNVLDADKELDENVSFLF